MSFGFASYYKDKGYDVTYLVDRAKNDKLCRPEFHSKDVVYPYPAWIKEKVVNSNVVTRAFPKFSYRKILIELSNYDIVFANDCGISLISYLREDQIKVALFHGSDLDVMCDRNKVELIAKQSWPRINILKGIKELLVGKTIDTYIAGIKKTDILSYFPKGLSPSGDDILDCEVGDDSKRIDHFGLPESKIFQIEKYNSLKKRNNSKLTIICPVRFQFNIEGGESHIDDKGNDFIIRGLSNYYSRNKNIEIRFFEKGRDWQLAKKQIDNTPLKDVVRWYGQKSYVELLDLYFESDICFDQVGSHWMGEIGFIALYMKIPLIANYRLDVFGKEWQNEKWIPNATTAEQVYEELCRLETIQQREHCAELANKFAHENHSLARTCEKIERKLNDF